MSSAIEVINLYKQYSLGVISYKNIKKDLQSFYSKLRGLEDPNSVINFDDDQLKKNQDYILALKNININFKEGGKIGVLGKNGSGKSTLLKIISRVTSPTAGNLKIYGSVRSLLEVGVGFHPELTGLENIYLSGSVSGEKKKDIDKCKDEIISFSGLDKYINTPVKRYSSGMIVKLGFSVATILDSDIILVDEVLAIADYEFREKALKKMKEISNNKLKTILFVSHNMDMIKTFCDECIVLDNGELIFQGNSDKAIEFYSKKK